jgi:hypothetical protein
MSGAALKALVSLSSVDDSAVISGEATSAISSSPPAWSEILLPHAANIMETRRIVSGLNTFI